MVAESYRLFIILGSILIIIGAALVTLPFIFGYMPTLEKLERLPKILVYVYRRDDFYFVTSPVLIIVGVSYFAYIIWRFLR